jgi:hypothetical protein
MQYRAIGLVRGRYEPSEEQFTKGNLVASDGSIIDSVLLGRVMSLVKKHIDLTLDHLWVVYPRTRDEHLHLQIMGVWEPETLHQETDDSEAEAEAVSEPTDAVAEIPAQESEAGEEAIADPDPPTSVVVEAAEAAIAAASEADPEEVPAADSAELSDAEPVTGDALDLLPSDAVSEIFSIRGEVITQDLEEQYITIKVKQAPRKPNDRGKSFKINIKGLLGNRAVGYFWDVQAERQGTMLAVTAATSIAMVPPKKRPKGKPGSGKPRSPRQSGGPRAAAPTPRPRANAPLPAPSPKSDS